MPSTPQSWASSPGVRRAMQGNKSAGTLPELRLAAHLRAFGLRPRRQVRLPIDGRRRVADFAWPGLRVAVFVDGCFWHRCAAHHVAAKTNAEFWRAKIDRNLERDQDTMEALAALGWVALRLWEHTPPLEAAAAVADAVERARST